MLEALCDPVFNPLLDSQTMSLASTSLEHRPSSSNDVFVTGSGHSRSLRGAAYRKSPQLGSHSVTYSHYYRSQENGGVAVLPMM